MKNTTFTLYCYNILCLQFPKGKDLQCNPNDDTICENYQMDIFKYVIHFIWTQTKCIVYMYIYIKYEVIILHRNKDLMKIFTISTKRTYFIIAV